MTPSKKLHYFAMPDGLRWSNQEPNQRLTRPNTLVKVPVSNQPQPKNHNGSKSTDPNKEEKSLRNSKPAKVDLKLLEEKEPETLAGNKKSEASASKDPKKGKNLTSKNKISEAQEKGEDRSSKPTFLISLTREEIELDYLVMTGKSLPRNGMKRDKKVQKGLDDLLPALSLDGHNADSLYKRYELKNGKH